MPMPIVLRPKQMIGLMVAAVAIFTLPLVFQHLSGAAGPARAAATTESQDERLRYMEEAAQSVQKWRQRVHSLAERAQAAGSTQALETRQRILAEWSLVENSWHVLSVSQGTAWEEAQVSFQQASDSFTRTWREQVSDDF